jgi:hypothetical protein
VIAWQEKLSPEELDTWPSGCDQPE